MRWVSFSIDELYVKHGLFILLGSRCILNVYLFSVKTEDIEVPVDGRSGKQKKLTKL